MLKQVQHDGPGNDESAQIRSLRPPRRPGGERAAGPGTGRGAGAPRRGAGGVGVMLVTDLGR